MRHPVESFEHPGFTKTVKKTIEDGKHVCVSLGFPYVRNIPPLGGGNQTINQMGPSFFCTKAPCQSFGLGPVSQQCKKWEVWHKQAQRIQQTQHESLSSSGELL